MTGFRYLTTEERNALTVEEESAYLSAKVAHEFTPAELATEDRRVRPCLGPVRSAQLAAIRGLTKAAR